MLKGHGDDIYNHNREINSNFSSNIFGRVDFAPLYNHLSNHLDVVRSYPEPDAVSMCRFMGEKLSVSPENIIVTNGATEAIYLVAQAFAEAKSTIIEPTFSEYEDACRIHRHQLTFCHSLFDIDADCDLVWICNPNNPNGFVYDADLLKDLINSNPHTIFVIDRSYAFFSRVPVLEIDSIVEFNHVIFIDSMTKKYAIPGIRLGCLIASQKNIERIEKQRMPWSVNALAIEAGKFLMNHPPAINLDSLFGVSDRFCRDLALIEGLKIYPSQTHFFLCEILNGKRANDLKTFLIENYGILIRDASNFRGLNESFFRLAAQTEQENNALIMAIKEWI